jgi:hypothetical protein
MNQKATTVQYICKRCQGNPCTLSVTYYEDPVTCHIPRICPISGTYTGAWKKVKTTAIAQSEKDVPIE